MSRSTVSTCCLSLLLASGATLMVVACSTSSNDQPAPDEGGIVGATPGDPDGSVAPPIACTKPADCPSRICTAGICAAPSPTDGVKNADETDVDCGGTKAPKCDALKTCAVAADCSTGVCKDKGQGLNCQPAAPDDGVKNGDETDVDCGGTKAPKCADTKGCKTRGDCTSDVCTAGVCVAPAPADGVQNGMETDIDCGGPDAPRCADLLHCKVAGDCTSSVCTGLVCQVPTSTDLVKNGVETDVDCGGVGNPKCGLDKTCAAHADCLSDGCAYNGKCALRRSCTGQYGGDTCGAGGAGGVGAATWESCCTTAPAGVGGVQMDKYQVTSGRMRAFLTRVNGNVRKAVQDARAANALHGATMNANWDLYLPTSMIGCDQDGSCGAGELTDHFYMDATNFQGIYTSALRYVGGSMFNGQSLSQQGCSVSSPGTHSYWMDAATQTNYFGDMPANQSQAVYDSKSQNCTPYLIAQAFCVWDGGRLETFAEWLAAIGSSAYPWGPSPGLNGPGSSSFVAFRYPTASDATLGLPAGQSREYGVFSYSYEFPQLDASGYDYISFIAAPGRTRGRGPQGHADLAGNLMEMTSDVITNNADPRTSTARWSSNGSFEGHGYAKTVQWVFTLLNKYGKQGLRCVYP